MYISSVFNMYIKELELELIERLCDNSQSRKHQGY